MRLQTSLFVAVDEEDRSMDESFWYIVELTGFILSGVLLILNVILFIRLQIPVLIGELSGKRYEKEVKQIRDSYMDYGRRNRGRKQEMAKKENSRPNPIERMSQESGHPEQKQTVSTDIIYQNRGEDTTVLSEQTTVLENQEATTVLHSDSQFHIVKKILLIHTDERIDQIYS